MADLAVKLGDVPPGTRTVLHVLLLVAFGIKAAVFPLSFWLPDSYPTAPGPGHRGVRRPADQGRRLRDHPHRRRCCSPADTLNTLLMVAALLTMLVGILGAVAQSDIKRLLSFTLVSHIGYMVFGIALSTVAGHGRRDLLRGAPHRRADHACSWWPG